MSHLPYNPFGKSLDKLETRDLIVLRNVAEGWYIEYKGASVQTRSIAKSLAAFANHYGGWLFYGIEGSRDGSDKAENFPGLDTHDAFLMLENIRNAAKDLINPSPNYEYRVLEGPAEEIGLAADHSIIVVLIPSGNDTPYVHGDGKIYRRVADASTPKAETDRFILDQLWNRKQKAQEALHVLLNHRPQLSKGEDDISYIQLYLLADPTNSLESSNSHLQFDDFVSIMSSDNSEQESIELPFDNFFTASDGYLCRHLFGNDPYNLAVTWRYQFIGNSIISIPLRKIPFVTPSADLNQLGGYIYERDFLRKINESGLKAGTIIDLHPIILLIAASVTKHKRLMEKGGISGSIFAKVGLEGIWRSTPFLDTQQYISFISEYGLPLVQDDSVLAPPGTNFDSLIAIGPHNIDYDMSEIAQQLIHSADLISNTMQSLGIPSSVLFEAEGDDNWIAAIMRAANIISRHIA